MDLQSSGCAQTTVGPAGGQGQCSRRPQQSCQQRERARYKRGGARWLDPRMLQTATHPALNIPPGWKHCMVTTWIQLQVSNIGQPTWVEALYGYNLNTITSQWTAHLGGSTVWLQLEYNYKSVTLDNLNVWLQLEYNYKSVTLDSPPGWKHCMVTTWIQLQVSNIGQPTWVKALYGINYNGYKSVAWNIPPGWKHYMV